MDRLLRFLRMSIVKKGVMALTGLGFLGFLTIHMIGNLTMLGGADLFNAYAENLHKLGPLVAATEAGLLVFALLHISMATLLFFGNRAARPERYAVDNSAGGRTWSSATMPYSGLVILLFVTVHLANFHFVDKGGRSVSEVVSGVFLQPAYVFFYVAAVIVLGLHVKHGFWSALQTLGANHPRYMPLAKGLSVALGVLFACVYGAIPLLVLAKGGLS